MKLYLGKKEMETVIKSYVYSNFNNCHPVWHFTSCKSAKKTEKIHQGCLRILLNDKVSDCKTILEKNGDWSMETKRLRVLSIKIAKAVDNLSPNFMKDVSTSEINARVRPKIITLRYHNSATYEDKSLKTLGPKNWNELPENIKSETSFSNILHCGLDQHADATVANT